MAGGDEHTVESNVLDMFGETADAGVVCRVCGALVADTDQFRQAHWDWHEASNGA